MAEYMGDTAELSIQSDGVGGSDGYNVLKQVRDLTINLDKATGDFTHRGSGGWRSEKGGIKQAGITFELIWDDADTVVQTLEDAYFDGDIIGVKALDKTSGTGLTTDVMVKTFTKNEPLEGPQTVSVELIITNNGTAPAWS